MCRRFFLFFLAAIVCPPLAYGGDASLDELQAELQSLQQRISTSGRHQAQAGYQADDSTAEPPASPTAARVGTYAVKGKVAQVETESKYTSGKSTSYQDMETRRLAVRLLLQQSSENVRYLQTLSTQQAVPAPYSESLRLSTTLLKNLTFDNTTSDAGYAQLQAINSDLHTKVAHAQQNRTAAFDPVKVTVHTRKEEHEVHGYEVWFAPAAYKDGRRDQRFEKYSSPTSQPLAPGNYYLWARRVADGTKGQRQIFGIGQGKTSHDIDIAAP